MDQRRLLFLVRIRPGTQVGLTGIKSAIAKRVQVVFAKAQIMT